MDTMTTSGKRLYIRKVENTKLENLEWQGHKGFLFRFFFFFSNAGDETQGITHARQVLYY
jgi:hypothetical protein